MIAENLNEPQGDELKNVQLMTATDLAKSLRISVRQVWRLNKRGLLPAPQRIGERIIRWSAAEIAAWLRAGSPPRERWEIMQQVKTEA